jgi:acetylornithine deacetylase/succinyl-diaminopimelate desuccinylase-like protein
MAELGRETTQLLQRLVRFNTVNPPGNERAAQEFLAGYLQDAGFECKLLARDPERPNLVARLRGRSDGPVLGYLGHVDTVLADPREWQRDPWSGEVVDGFLWGRGALDMKSQVASEAAAGAELARSGWRPEAGDLLLLFVADEEAGGEWGAAWLVAEHPDEARCDYLLNEGGGEVFEYQGRRHFGVSVAEKGVFRFTVETDGVAGHASTPGLGDNALLKMAPLLERLRTQPGLDPPQEAIAMLRALGEDGDDPAGAAERMRAADPRLAVLVDAMLRVTLVPTRISASEKVNVIPSRARLLVDCRTPPGLGEAEVRGRISEVLGENGYRVEFSSDGVVGNRSPAESPLMDAIVEWIGREEPEAAVVPTMLPAFTDSRWFRDAFPDCVAYGFYPQRHMTLFESFALVHAPDERIDVRDLDVSARFFRDLPDMLLR